VRNIIRSVFGIRSIKTLFYRILTVALVLIHYYYVEKISIEEWLPNGYDLASFILTQHFIFMMFKVVEESRRKKNVECMHMIFSIIVCLSIYTLLTFILTPIYAWHDSEKTRLQTSYYTWRYIMMGLYIIMNIVINVFPLVNNFMFFLSDGIILSQITSLYMFNEFSMTSILTILPVLFVIQNHGLIRGI